MPMTSRRAARLAVNQRQPRTFDPPRTPDGHRLPVSAYFARHVLDIIKLKERLPREAYQALLATLRTGAPLSPRGGQRHRLGGARLGHRARRHALHPLVPADDRAHRREARLVHRPERDHAGRAQGARALRRHAAHPERAGRLARSPRAACAPPSRRAATPPGTRPRPCSWWRARTGARCACRRCSSRTTAIRSTTRRRCCARSRPWTGRRWRSSSCSATWTCTRSAPRWGSSRSTSCSTATTGRSAPTW